jgi:hypothetical protein
LAQILISKKFEKKIVSESCFSLDPDPEPDPELYPEPDPELYPDPD